MRRKLHIFVLNAVFVVMTLWGWLALTYQYQIPFLLSGLIALILSASLIFLYNWFGKVTGLFVPIQLEEMFWLRMLP